MRSRPSSAAPATGGTSTIRGSASGASPASRLVISAVSSGSRAASTPPPSATRTGWSSRPRRRMAVTAITHTSPACRRKMSRATASWLAATSNRTRTRPRGASQPSFPLCSATATSYMRATPKWAATASRSAVCGPRPSSARIAHQMASTPRLYPPPQSPLVGPSERNLVIRPSGATPTQLIPAPHVTPTPQCAPESSRPARSTAKVSLATSMELASPRARNPALTSSSSSGRSALATQADTCSATGRPAGAAGTSALPVTRRASEASTSIACSRVSMLGTPGPRALASSVPSAATSAASVLLLPASSASTAGSGFADSPVTFLPVPKAGIARSRR